MIPDKTQAPETTDAPATEKKIVERVMIARVSNGFLVHETGCKEDEIKIAPTLDEATQLVAELLA